MDSTENENASDDLERKYRTIWIGNLHPKVTENIIAELFFQMGPVECVQYGYDQYDRRENFAWVTFRNESSVDDSMQILEGTKLFGLTIKMKNYLENSGEQMFDENLDYFKQLNDIELDNHSSHTFSNKKNTFNFEESVGIPDSLPLPPVNERHKYNHDNHFNLMTEQGTHDSISNYQELYSNNYVSRSRGEYNTSTDNPYANRNRNQRSEDNNTSRSLEMTNDNCKKREYHNRRNLNKQQDYCKNKSSNWDNNSFHNEELPTSTNSSDKNMKSMCDLRDTLQRKYSLMDSENPNDYKAACASTNDFGDKDQNIGNESNVYNQWPKRYNRNATEHSYGNYIERGSRNCKLMPEHYNERNMKTQDHFENQEHCDRNSSKDTLHKGFQEFNEYTNSYDERYNQGMSRPNNHKYNLIRSSHNLDSNNRPYNNYNHPYKRNNGNRERKGFKEANDDYSGNSKGRGYNNRASEFNNKSRQNY
ncbi:probable serine/threonine-protein kinase clkA [Adelges cooleyi]|uniref:probable serine/threonine-protein kinase clkA n=1 Tax=Adelges cooleyi TaxID=133065 RepID=UPI00217FD841|nr:probable serine/threonine-protein kinase clkA [Adelges cooleyi]XP_050440424.1 probable serine/threonine-protein kinase clkA [Adelges cooleyi]